MLAHKRLGGNVAMGCVTGLRLHCNTATWTIALPPSGIKYLITINGTQNSQAHEESPLWSVVTIFHSHPSK
jgi:hypothetical protein